jgi:TRAP-type C4-dicarboxylate transport system permease small subunit
MPMSWVYYGMVVGGAYLFLVVLRRIFLNEKPVDKENPQEQQPIPQ